MNLATVVECYVPNYSDKVLYIAKSTKSLLRLTTAALQQQLTLMGIFIFWGLLPYQSDLANMILKKHMVLSY